MKRLKIADDQWISVLNNYALRIGLPVLIFLSISKVEIDFSKYLPLIIANSALVLFGFLIIFLFCKLTKVNKTLLRTLFVCLMFSNVAYLGIPVLTKVRGVDILPEVSLVIAIYIFWMFTVGTGFLEYTQNIKTNTPLRKIFKKLLLNPLLIAIILGILTAFLKIKLHPILTQTLEMVSASVTPTVLIVIGLFVGDNKIGKLREWVSVSIFALATLFFVPGLLYFGVKFFGFSPSTFGISIIEAAMPLAITPFALAQEYGLDRNFIARSVVLSTVLSVITIPFWVSIL